jgi:excisionase family DNA binding protein
LLNKIRRGFLSFPENTMADAPTASSERSTTDSPRLDPVAERLRDSSDVFARLAALEACVGRAQFLANAQYARPPPDDERAVRVYTVKEVAGLLRIGLSRTYEAIIAGRIPAIRFGGRWLVPHNELVGLLERLKKERGLDSAA